jgi:division protein CdvB (Snf7/Vps24/ESCRT-III family)
VNKAVIATLSTIASIILGWLWVESHFVTNKEAAAVHTELARADENLKKVVTEATLELKIDDANTMLAFIERGGVEPDEQRQYDLLQHTVKAMTTKLMEQP